MNDDLYLLRLELGLRQLVDLAKRRGISMRRGMDEGYAVHCALGELFRDTAPKLFALPSPHARQQTPERLGIYAYSRRSKNELLEQADAFGDVALHDSFDRASFAERKLPGRFPSVVGFSVRLCPIVRLKRDGGPPGSGSRSKGREVDAFEAACIRNHAEGRGRLESDERTRTYLKWFDDLVSRADSIELVDRRVVGMRLVDLIRRDRKHTSRRLCRPDVLVRGRLKIRDQEGFRGLLAHGIGRHKAFGFGMLMLFPAGEA